ncbi:hypothetical protein L596_020740 [Steinernema carpocapsae]|uniref:7TM GPCR serpentine receptor class x (Srx) domain-containing protein n=1 Tax=Steinernema carpocapsae TaxID=34508 RepID=A0A4U5MUF5_STECR|nr:hypothetical protein L596_020740 [Steinernema carpocapsae]
MCVACMLQLVSIFAGGFMTLTDIYLGYIPDKILGAILQGAWLLYVGLSLTLAVDRISVFLLPLPSQRKLAIRIHMSCLILSYILGLAFLVSLSLGNCSYTYRSEIGLFTWFYTEDPGSKILGIIEPYIDLTCLTLVFIIYLIVFGLLIKMSRMSSQPSHNLKRETRILIVSITCFFYETAFVIWCNFGSILFQPSILIDVVANIFWMYDSGIFSLGLIVMNAGIRKQMLKMCGFVPRTNVIAVGRAPTKTLP